MIKYLRFLILICFTTLSVCLKAQTIDVINTGKATSIRGLSVLNNKVAWISGSKGLIGITHDGGKNWSWPAVKGFENSDFRDIEAFSDKEAIVMSSGTPALILKTTDGGANWEIKFRSDDKAYFLDALDFDSSNHGLALGDPIDGKYLLLETNNGGNSWQKLQNQPKATPGQAAFAASGTCLRAAGNKFYIVTGGSEASLIVSNNTNFQWQRTSMPITHGKDSQGMFSIAVGKKTMIMVGGDYSINAKRDSNACYSVLSSRPRNAGLPASSPAGYQSCVEYINNDTFLSTGTPGSNLTTDGGKTWRLINITSFNVCRKARHGNLVLLAGDDGKIGICKL
ncbi:WD40/YVTN/BNR-like repeat-containing protein [Mucilaginibacter sp.]|uniref:WD40/YVTN/BNR-like repeat-containing protein n=1 Tax=Mucilaginibacter sp. TaxID=1882438 RepID=UPI0035BC1430